MWYKIKRWLFSDIYDSIINTEMDMRGIRGVIAAQGIVNKVHAKELNSLKEK